MSFQFHMYKPMPDVKEVVVVDSSVLQECYINGWRLIQMFYEHGGILFLLGRTEEDAAKGKSNVSLLQRLNEAEEETVALRGKNTQLQALVRNLEMEIQRLDPDD